MPLQLRGSPQLPRARSSRPHDAAHVWLSVVDRRLTGEVERGSGNRRHPPDGISGGQEAVALVVFVVLASLTILAPVAIFMMGPKAKGILDGLKGFMGAHNAAIMTVLLLVLGAKLIGDSIGGLSA